MSTWYRLQKYTDTIGEIEVERFTADSIWFRSSYDGKLVRSKRKSSYDEFFPTREEARQALIRRITDELKFYRGRVAALEQSLATLS